MGCLAFGIARFFEGGRTRGAVSSGFGDRPSAEFDERDLPVQLTGAMTGGNRRF